MKGGGVSQVWKKWALFVCIQGYGGRGGVPTAQRGAAGGWGQAM